MATAPETTSPETAAPETSPAAPADLHDYRAICSAAVTSMVIAVIGLSAFWLSGFLLIPIVSLLLGIYAWLTIRRRQDELTGASLATLSIIVSLITLVSASAWHSYVYITEVPDGFQRISYRQLQVNPSRPSEGIPASAKELEGQQVFIKGYMLDKSKAAGIKDFFLVRDKGDCCFGGKPEIDQRVLVLLEDQLAEYSDRHSKVIGKFELAPGGLMKEGVQGPVLYIIRGELIE
jgi:hypothetical protein